MSSPRFPRLPSVWDGPLGPSKEVLAPEDRPVRTLPRRRAAETPPSPRLPAATPLAGPQDVPAKVLDALEAELLGGPAPAAPAGDPALAAETSSTLAALGGAYDAVLRELAEPEVSAEALVRSWPDQAPSRRRRPTPAMRRRRTRIPSTGRRRLRRTFRRPPRRPHRQRPPRRRPPSHLP